MAYALGAEPLSLYFISSNSSAKVKQPAAMKCFLCVAFKRDKRKRIREEEIPLIPGKKLACYG